MERTNPIAAKGATPTMGVSQKRGGAKKWIQEAVSEPSFKEGAFTKQAIRQQETPMEYATEVLKNPEAHTLKTRRRAQFVKNVVKGRGKVEESSSEEEKEGGMMHDLGLGEMVGSGMTRHVGAGKELKGGFFGALLSAAIPLISNLFGKGDMNKKAHDELMAMMKSAEKKGAGDLHGGFWGSLISAAVPLISSLFGKGKMDKEAHDQLMAVFKPAGKKGGRKSKALTSNVSGPGYEAVSGGAKEGGFHMVYLPASQSVSYMGKTARSSKGALDKPTGSGIGGEQLVSGSAIAGGKKVRKPVGENDGRRKRAAVVKKVMEEQGLSMIEASKYVKAHGLY